MFRPFPPISPSLLPTLLTTEAHYLLDCGGSVAVTVYRSIQIDYRQRFFFWEELISDYRYRIALPEELISITETDHWEFQQKISRYRYRFSLEFQLIFHYRYRFRAQNELIL